MALIGSNIFIGNNDEQMFIGTDRYDKTTEPTFVGIITGVAGFFGASVAVGNNRIVVGAPYKDNPTDREGEVYIYDFDENLVGVITASDAAQIDLFGWSVAVGSGRIVVGAYLNDDNGNASGSAYIYDLDGNEVGIITASDGAADDYFGWSVAVGSGRIVVGAFGNDIGSNTGQGSAYIFDLNGNEVGIITAIGAYGAGLDWFGYSVAVGSGRIVVGEFRDDEVAGDAGKVHIYDLNGNEVGIITASDGAFDDWFGKSVAVGSGRIVVGNNEEQVYVYDLDGNEIKILTGDNPSQNDFYGKVDLAESGTPIAVGSGRIVVGASRDDEVASDAGKVYIYDLNGNEVGIITASDGASGDHFGSAIGVENGKIVAGAPLKDDNGISNRGGIYIYDTPKSNHILDTLDR